MTYTVNEHQMNNTLMPVDRSISPFFSISPFILNISEQFPGANHRQSQLTKEPKAQHTRDQLNPSTKHIMSVLFPPIRSLWLPAEAGGGA